MEGSAALTRHIGFRMRLADTSKLASNKGAVKTQKYKCHLSVPPYGAFKRKTPSLGNDAYQCFNLIILYVIYVQRQPLSMRPLGRPADPLRARTCLILLGEAATSQSFHCRSNILVLAFCPHRNPNYFHCVHLQVLFN